jgi:hydroxyethylthiazole kinase-like uncharacterized protein yjeF
MKVVTADQMREIEQRAAEMGLSSEVLMQNAGLSIAQKINEWLGDVVEQSILILIGPGNNGGDGLVAARHLHDWGARVQLYCPKLRAGSDPNYQETQDRIIPCVMAGDDDSLNSVLSSADVVVDALFGTGKSRPLEGVYKETLESVRMAREANPKLKLIAVDLPSGLNPDTGAVDPSCLRCDFTITLANPKIGVFIFPGAAKVGRLVVGDIGTPAGLADDINTEVMTDTAARVLLPSRPPNANKGTFGKVLVIAGSINYVGAAHLACAAAARVGAGLVTLATTRSLHSILASSLIEVTHIPLPESEPGVIGPEASKAIEAPLSEYNTVLLGCGLGQNSPTQQFIESTLAHLSTSSASLVLDADALNILGQIPQWWQRLPQDVVVTPHPGEMSRLSGVSIEEIQSDRLGAARRMATLWHKTVVLKGAYTVVASPDTRARICPSANPALASAGTGDVLAGTIAGLLAQGLSLFDAATLGVYVHAEAGEILRSEMGDAGVLASDMLPMLPAVIEELKADNT